MNSSNSILDESFVDETHLNANQPAIVRRCFDETTSDEVMEVREESRNEQQRPDNKEILDALEVITLRLATIETNQVVLQKNQEIISPQVEELVEKMVNKSEMLAENKILRECKVTLQKIELSIGGMTGEVRDQILDEVASSFPINSITSVSDIEDKIMNRPEYAQAMITYFHKLKGASEDVSISRTQKRSLN
ncbi:uncharacterized protein LOC118750401 [Rhagoletis pomonella]|uniref:uncharacterized protein LOC118750401 n=1 Tax=Rhagoletis pomonella TaxID=28610 RepID=UPI00177B6EE8|nr:uncharacterized protein LOC118750401 [Rhagoletis pomonella]XP_036341014.1 uncharacterized protein LOC118750401 [Rhagoletis pomonella]XP_036341015.1 uncharacterized protein LOC118750401 [Rhagoletis pomonella]